MSPEERWLLVKAVEIAARYGSLGGKTTLKPQKRPRVGDDYGLVRWQDGPQVQKADIEKYLSHLRWRSTSTKDPDLRWFFYMQGALLWRSQINKLIGLSEDGRSIVGCKEYQNFLRGRRSTKTQPAASKKIFSFRADGGRIWGYARNAEMRDQIIQHIRELLKGREYIVKTGQEVLNEL